MVSRKVIYERVADIDPDDIKPEDYDGKNCPACKSVEIRAEPDIDTDNPLLRKVGCENCGFNWTEDLKFCGYHDLQPPALSLP